MDEAEQLCDRLVVIDRGGIVARGTPRDLIREHVTREVLELRLDDDDAQDTAAQKLRSSSVASGEGEHIEELPDRLLVYAQDGDAALAEARALGVEPLTALVRRATLEDVFLRLTGRSLVD
jgi:lipooligosaccharide transport system ATP-binding protein